MSAKQTRSFVRAKHSDDAILLLLLRECAAAHRRKERGCSTARDPSVVLFRLTITTVLIDLRNILVIVTPEESSFSSVHVVVHIVVRHIAVIPLVVCLD